MKRDEFLRIFAKKAGLSLSDAREVLDAMRESLIMGICSEGGVKPLTGFKFYRELKPEHTKRNPQNGEIVTIPEQYYVKVKIGDNVKAEINAIAD